MESEKTAFEKLPRKVRRKIQRQANKELKKILRSGNFVNYKYETSKGENHEKISGDN